MRPLLAYSLLGLGLAAAQTGCSTRYTPKGPGVSIVMQGGGIAFARDGQVVEHGFFGGGLIEVVEGDSEATEEAESYRDLSAAGFGVTLGGLALSLGGSGFLLGASLEDFSTDAGNNLAIAAAAMSVTGVGMLLAGAILTINAQPKLFDAINLYNDGLEDPKGDPLPAPPQVVPPQQPIVPLPAPPPAAPAIQ